MCSSKQLGVLALQMQRKLASGGPESRPEQHVSCMAMTCIRVCVCCHLQADVVLVMDQDRLYTQLTERLKVSPVELVGCTEPGFSYLPLYLHSLRGAPDGSACVIPPRVHLVVMDQYTQLEAAPDGAIVHRARGCICHCHCHCHCVCPVPLSRTRWAAWAARCQW